MVKNEGGVGQAQARGRAARWGPEVGTAERRRGTLGQMAAEAMGVALSLHPSFCSLCSLYLLPAPHSLSLPWVSSSSCSSQLFHPPNKAIHAGGRRPVVSPLLLSILPVLKCDSIRAAALGLQLLPGLDVGHEDPDLGFPAPARLLRAVEQACFTSHPGWRRARMPSLEIAFLPESNGFLSATVPLT